MLEGSPAPPSDTTLTAAFPFFPVTTQKSVALSVCTFGLYELYWFYENWKRVRAATRSGLNPFWRSALAWIWCFSLFQHIRKRAARDQVEVRWSPWLLGTLFCVLTVLSALPGPLGLLPFLASLMVVLPVQATSQQINQGYLSREDRNASFSTLNLAAIIAGGMLWILAIVGVVTGQRG
jgi:hypothetical protein